MEHGDDVEDEAATPTKRPSARRMHAESDDGSDEEPLARKSAVKVTPATPRKNTTPATPRKNATKEESDYEAPKRTPASRNTTRRLIPEVVIERSPLFTKKVADAATVKKE